MMPAKTWNVRDQPTEALRKECEKYYTLIVRYNRWIAKALTMEEAKSWLKKNMLTKQRQTT